MIEVIRVTFVLILQLVEEVKDVESERCRRLMDRCWKPAGTEELDTFGRAAITVAVLDDEAVGPRQVKDHEVLEGRRVWAHAANAVIELDDEASRGKGGALEEVSIPFLAYISINIQVRCDECEKTYLNLMERSICVP